MEPDNVLICWCIMRQLEIRDPDAIADIMGTTETHVILLMQECGERFKAENLTPSLFTEDDGA